MPSYRFPIFRRATRNRHDHSIPTDWTHFGARRTRPVSTSKLPPTPIITGTFRCLRWCSFQVSLNGLGIPTNSTSGARSEEHTSELQSHLNLVYRLLLEKTNT